MPLPTLSPEQRAAALEKAAEIRKARAELKEQLKAGKTTLPSVLDQAESDEVVGKLKVSAYCRRMPGIGKVRATQIMEKLKIAESRRLRGSASSSARLCSPSSPRRKSAPDRGRNEQSVETSSDTDDDAPGEPDSPSSPAPRGWARTA